MEDPKESLNINEWFDFNDAISLGEGTTGCALRLSLKEDLYIECIEEEVKKGSYVVLKVQINDVEVVENEFNTMVDAYKYVKMESPLLAYKPYRSYIIDSKEFLPIISQKCPEFNRRLGGSTDFRYSSNRLCIIESEYINSGSLLKYIEEKSIKMNVIDYIIKQVSFIFDILHKNEIIHRDLKTSNIGLSIIKERNFPIGDRIINVPDDFNFTIKILDFGLSSCGKLSYLCENLDLKYSPLINYIKGTKHELTGKYINEQVDIWSFGLLITDLAISGHTIKKENVKSGKLKKDLYISGFSLLQIAVYLYGSELKDIYKAYKTYSIAFSKKYYDEESQIDEKSLYSEVQMAVFFSGYQMLYFLGDDIPKETSKFLKDFINSNRAIMFKSFEYIQDNGTKVNFFEHMINFIRNKVGDKIFKILTMCLKWKNKNTSFKDINEILFN
jgi:serine/threonine protein kinase